MNEFVLRELLSKSQSKPCSCERLEGYRRYILTSGLREFHIVAKMLDNGTYDPETRSWVVPPKFDVKYMSEVTAE